MRCRMDGWKHREQMTNERREGCLERGRWTHRRDGGPQKDKTIPVLFLVPSGHSSNDCMKAGRTTQGQTTALHKAVGSIPSWKGSKCQWVEDAWREQSSLSVSPATVPSSSWRHDLPFLHPGPWVSSHVTSSWVGGWTQGPRAAPQLSREHVAASLTGVVPPHHPQPLPPTKDEGHRLRWPRGWREGLQEPGSPEPPSGPLITQAHPPCPCCPSVPAKTCTLFSRRTNISGALGLEFHLAWIPRRAPATRQM